MTHTEKAASYVNDVLSGRIDVCRWVKLACERHVRDLEESKFKYDEDKANRVCRFIELFPHSKGKWAAKRLRITLEPWQCFGLCSVFGWVDPETELRRFSRVYWFTPRKNGKSLIGAAIGLYMMLADHEASPEVFSGATTEAQAGEIFNPAKLMIAGTPAVKRKWGVFIGAKQMASKLNGGKFRLLTGKPGDGASPSCALVDEYHEHDTDALFDTMSTGMMSREQGLIFILTTAGVNLAGPCRMFQNDVEDMLSGKVQNDTLFALLYTLDDADDWKTEAALRKCNPNYGVSVIPKTILAEQSGAIRSSRKQNIFLTKHTNRWMNASSSWMNMVDWDKCGDAPLISEMLGVPCYVALDLASKNDITARAKLFKKVIGAKEHYYAYLDCYLPALRANDPGCQHYQAWIHDGLLVATPGAAIDMGAILDDTGADIVKYRVKELAFDPWHADHLAQDLAKRKQCPIIEFKQQVQTMSGPMKHMEALVSDGRFHHDNNPILKWMVSNVVCYTDVKDNIYPRKVDNNSPLKIDGVVACIMALSRAMAGGGTSVYDIRGVR